jgi:hypothetical protein
MINVDDKGEGNNVKDKCDSNKGQVFQYGEDDI